MDAFAACLADDASLALVESDLADGAPFVRGTPTFIVLQGGEGSIIPGALPAESFSEALQQVVERGRDELEPASVEIAISPHLLLDIHKHRPDGDFLSCQVVA